MRQVEVTAAIVIEGGRLLAARRPSSAVRGGLWELPGGKREPGETLQRCLRRELVEELGVEVEVGTLFMTTTHDYPDLRVTLHAFRCRRQAQQLTPSEHDQVRWLTADQLEEVPWCGADLPLVTELRRQGLLG